MPIPVIALIGPTAVGKTALSLDLARDINGEIISVDSRQVYRYMDIGTDKIDPLTRREILHHLIDVTDPDQIFSASDFADLGRKAIKSIISRGKVPILAGGTPFYYRALLDDSLNIPVPSDEKIREELSSLGDGEEGNELRHEILQDLDMERASRIHKNDKLRVIRAIEICKVTGKPMSLWMKERPSENRDYDTLYLGLTRSKEDLLKIIESRVRRQFSSGYPEEVKWLLSKGFSGDLPSMKGFGYRELVRYFSKEIT